MLRKEKTSMHIRSMSQTRICSEPNLRRGKRKICILNKLNCFFFLLLSFVVVNGVELAAYLSQNGLHGEIHFSQSADGAVRIESSLETTLQHPDQIWSWNVHQMPVDYAETNSNRRCSAQNLGIQLISFDDSLGYLVLPGNESSTWNANIHLTGKYIE